MPQGRQKSPGSFRDELGGVIERIAPPKPKAPKKKPDKIDRPVRSAAELNDRLFWRKPYED